MEFEDREKSRERRGNRECYSKLENVDIYNKCHVAAYVEDM